MFSALYFFRIWISNDIRSIQFVYLFVSDEHNSPRNSLVPNNSANPMCSTNARRITPIILNAHFNLLIYFHLLSPITFDHLKWLNLIEFNWQTDRFLSRVRRSRIQCYGRSHVVDQYVYISVDFFFSFRLLIEWFAINKRSAFHVSYSRFSHSSISFSQFIFTQCDQIDILLLHLSVWSPLEIGICLRFVSKSV